MHPPQGYSPEFVPATSLIGRIEEKLAASRFLTYSILFHVILLVLAGAIVVMRPTIPDEQFAGPVGLPDEPVVLNHDTEPVLPTPTSFVPQPPTITTPPIEVLNSTAQETHFTVPMVAPTLKNLLGESAPLPPPVPPGTVPGGNPNNMPTSMLARVDEKARQQAMDKLGMKAKSEQAVLKGLRWLKDHQNEDGSWSAQYAPSMTGLALLCFLGHGELPQSPEFGPTVKNGVDWLLDQGTKFGGRLSMTQMFTQSGVYEHAMATYALGEYYTMTKDDRVKDVFAQAVAHIVAGQAPDGGWQYAYAKGPDSDTSVTGWQIQALKAAHLSGLNLPGVDEALDRAMLDLQRVQGPKGGFGYRTAQDSYSLTGAGVLCTYFWKGEKDKSVRDGIKFILDETENNYPVQYNGNRANLYAWYYHTQACLMYGGPAWTKWNKWFQDQIADNQSPDGSWPATGGKAAGPQSEEKNAGPFYRTTLCVLMLEVYYRYMPTNN